MKKIIITIGVLIVLGFLGYFIYVNYINKVPKITPEPEKVSVEEVQNLDIEDEDLLLQIIDYQIKVMKI